MANAIQQKATIAAVVVMSIVVVLATSIVALADDNGDFQQRTYELKLTEDYMDFVEVDGYRLQTLKVESALDDELISPATVALAVEIVAFQNAMVMHAHYATKQDIDPKDKERLLNEHPKPDVGDYGKIESFFAKATKNAKQQSNGKTESSGGTGIGTVRIGKKVLAAVGWPIYGPCGGFGTPIPDVSYSWEYRNTGDAVTYFINNGYHVTASYVHNSRSDRKDYTKGRKYRSEYGTCSSPRFRDHGVDHLGSDTYQVQIGGEPNPEIHTYVWPYLTWPAYVAWWHETR